MEKQNLEEVWIGLKAVKGLPRTSGDWQYLSSHQEQMTNTVFEILEQDDGRNMLGKIFSFSQYFTN